MARNRNRSADLDERRHHAEEFVRSLPPAPEYGPLTDEERAGIEDTLRRFAARCGDPWHERVMWVGSPAEFHKLSRNDHLRPRRSDRLAHRVAVVGYLLLRVGRMLLWPACLLSPYLWTGVLWWTGVHPLWNAVVGFVSGPLYIVFFMLIESSVPPRRPALRVRPLRVRMPRGVRPGTPGFRAWLPRDVLSGVGHGPDGRVVLSTAGVAASSLQNGEFLGGPCGRSADLYPVRFRGPLRLGRRQAFDGHLRPSELAWLLERGEVAPRRFARTLLRTHAQLERAFAVRMYRNCAVVLEPPVRFRTERLPDGASRVHCADGPAIEWASGERTCVLHGVRVPDDLVERGWGVQRIAAEGNSEVRRAAIERMGWATYVREAGMQPRADAPDPGNADRSLRLYHDSRLNVCVLLMANGSPDRSGETREYAELVPSTMWDPVDAAAWQYGVPAETYRQLQRRT